MTPFFSLGHKALIHEEELWEDTSEDHEVLVKFLSSRRNFLQKNPRQTEVLLASCLRLTHVGSRRVLLAFLFSGEYPDHQAVATLLISISFIGASATFCRLPERKWPSHSAAVHTSVALQWYLVQAPINTTSNNCNNLIILIQVKMKNSPRKSKDSHSAGQSDQIRPEAKSPASLERALNWLFVAGYKLQNCRGVHLRVKRERFWPASLSRRKQSLPRSSKNLIQLLKELPNHMSNLIPGPIWFFAFCCSALG